MTNWTAACWRAGREDRNGHLDHPIWSPDRKVMPPGKSPMRPCMAGRPDIGRPAWHLLKTLATHHHSLEDSQIDPKHLEEKPKVKLRPKGLICPSNVLPKWPLGVGLIIQGLELHLHAKKHKGNQFQPSDWTQHKWRVLVFLNSHREVHKRMEIPL